MNSFMCSHHFQNRKNLQKYLHLEISKYQKETEAKNTPDPQLSCPSLHKVKRPPSAHPFSGVEAFCLS